MRNDVKYSDDVTFETGLSNLKSLFKIKQILIYINGKTVFNYLLTHVIILT